MTIIRSPRIQRDFTIISNSVCLDQRLSMRALGVLVRLLCRPDNWRTNSETLAREFGCGREQMRSVLRELSAAGYMQLVKARDERGQWATYWAVFDEPQPGSDQLEQDHPKTGVPGPGNPLSGGMGAITRTDLTRTENKNPPPPKGERKTGRFAEFWEAWPRHKRKVAKAQCEAKWRSKGCDAIADRVIEAVVSTSKSQDWTKDGGEFIPSPLVWLNQARWEADTSEIGKQSSQFVGVI